MKNIIKLDSGSEKFKNQVYIFYNDVLFDISNYSCARSVEFVIQQYLESDVDIWSSNTLKAYKNLAKKLGIKKISALSKQELKTILVSKYIEECN